MKKATAKKYSKRDAAYVDHATKRHCAGCKYFEPKAACELVDGTINPEGSCRYYEKKTSKN